MPPSITAQYERHRALIGQLVRYLFTGGLASIVNIGVYGLLNRAEVNELVSWTCGFVSAVAVGYVVHSRWSFRGHGRRGNLARTGGRFVVVSLVSFALNLFWVWLLVTHMGQPRWAPIPLVLGVTPLFIFSLNRRWVFE